MSRVAVIFSLIALSVLALFLAALALSAVRRARLRGLEQSKLDFSDAETVQFSRDILEAQEKQSQELDEE